MKRSKASPTNGDDGWPFELRLFEGLSSSIQGSLSVLRRAEANCASAGSSGPTRKSQSPPRADRTGVVDAVADGVTGRLVDPFDVAELAGALQQYLEDDELRAQHGQAGRQRVARLFSRALVWKTLLTFYASLAPLCRPLAKRATECTDAA